MKNIKGSRREKRKAERHRIKQDLHVNPTKQRYAEKEVFRSKTKKGKNKSENVII